MTISDDDIRAYLDGNSAKAGPIEAAMATDAGFEERVLALDPLSDTLGSVREAFPPMPDTAPLASVTETAPVERPSTLWAQIVPFAAGAAAALAVVALVSALAPPQEIASADWRSQVAIYQALYTPQTIAPVVEAPGDLSAELARAAALAGTALPEDVLTSIPALDLVRTQVLGVEGQPLVQIVYSTADGVPVALCAFGPGEGDAGLEMAERAGLQSAAFEAGGASWLLIGGQDSAFLETTAQHLISAL